MPNGTQEAAVLLVGWNFSAASAQALQGPLPEDKGRPPCYSPTSQVDSECAGVSSEALVEPQQCRLSRANVGHLYLSYTVLLPTGHP